MEVLAGVNEGGGINFVIPQMTPVTLLRSLIAVNCTVNVLRVEDCGKKAGVVLAVEWVYNWGGLCRGPALGKYRM